MSVLRVALACAAIGAGVLGLVDTVPLAVDGLYGELPIFAIPFTLWAVWFGHRRGAHGPCPPAGHLGFSIGVCIGAWLMVLIGAGWAASFFIAPAVFLVTAECWPKFATPRILFLLLLVPTSYLLDSTWGSHIREATAAASGALAQIVDPELGVRKFDTLLCSPHEIIVTPACSGARFSVRMMTLGAVLIVLTPVSWRHVFVVLAAALAFSVIANVARVAAVCIAAPKYSKENLGKLELYHDVSGLFAFIAAYLVLAWLVRRLHAHGRRAQTQ